MISSLGSAVSGIAGGFLSTAGSKLIDGIFGTDPNKANRRIMAEQNSFNSAEAQKNRDFQLQMYGMTNAYNSPKSQIRRYVDAGLNPDLIYGAGAGGISTPAQSPSGSQASGTAPIAALDMQQRAADINKTNAETSLIKAEEKKTGVDTQTALTYNEFQRQLLTGQIEYQGVQIVLGNSAAELNDAQKQVAYETVHKIIAETQLAYTSCDELNAKIENYDADTALKKLEHLFQSKSFDDRLNSIIAEKDLKLSQIGLNKAQISYMAQQLIIARCHLNLEAERNQIAWMTGAASADQSDAMSRYYKINGDQVQWNLEVDQGKHPGALSSQQNTWKVTADQIQTLAGIIGPLISYCVMAL